MSKNSNEFPENFPKISKIQQLYPEGEGYDTWRKIPDIISKLPKLIGAKTNDVVVAYALAHITARESHYPTFSVGRSEIAEVTALSPRAISSSIKFLTSKNMIYVHSSMGQSNRYTWNDEFFKKGIAGGSLLPVNHVHSYQCTTFTPTSERPAHIYIELSLDIFISSFREFFSDDKPCYNFYVPAKRRKKILNIDAPKGETIQVSRKEAWREAAYNAYEKIKHYDDALPRIYLSLMASRNLDEVKHPKTVLEFRVMDTPSIEESKSKSHLREYMHTNLDFQDFADKKLSAGGIQ